MVVGVVGHVEWVEFLRVERVPCPGEIVQARAAWGEPAGGGAVAAVELARLAGGATLLTALGDDDVGRRAATDLERLGLVVEAVWRSEPQRRAFTYLDDDGERTITLLTPKLRPAAEDALPWSRLADFDALYFTGGDAASVREARRARILVATARELPTLVEAGVELDALVRSGGDESEAYARGDLEPVPRVVVSTGGDEGGEYELADGTSRRYEASPLPGPRADSYGAGDSFAAGLTYALGAGLTLDAALRLAADSGALALTRRGAYDRRLLP